ncbi:MAG: hypothetical protein AB7O47_00590 [Flavobacteriales bacterium]
MKSLNKLFIYNVLVLIFIGYSNQSFGQCTSFTKKQGFPVLSPFIHNGQITSTKFMPGDEADIEMTFNAGSDYRVLVVFQEVLGNVTFQIKDKTGKILFTSKDGDTTPFWDFRVNTTQQLMVSVLVPKMDEKTNKILPQGCISVLIGFKPQENSSKVKMMK